MNSDNLHIINNILDEFEPENNYHTCKKIVNKILKKELFNSEVLKNMRLFEEGELLQLIGFIIKMTLMKS